MAAAAAAGWIWRWGWGRRCPGRSGLRGPGPGPTILLLFLLLLGPVAADITDGNSEHLKREHSLIKPYHGIGSSSTLLWDFQGSTMLTSQYVRLTPDERSKEGSIWNHLPCFLKDWEMHVHFKVHGAGKKNLHGDGIALWYTRDRLVPGPVFGSKDNFHGLAIFLDTYPNDETTERVFPYISVMVNNGSLSYDHSKDGRWTELAGCTADFRNRDHDTFLAVRYSRGRLTVMTDLEDKNEWKNCIDITGVRLPTGYYFGASAGTGDLSGECAGSARHPVSVWPSLLSGACDTAEPLPPRPASIWFHTCLVFFPLFPCVCAVLQRLPSLSSVSCGGLNLVNPAMDPHVSLSRPESPATCPAGLSAFTRAQPETNEPLSWWLCGSERLGGVPASAFSLTGRLPFVGMSCWLSLLFTPQQTTLLPSFTAGRSGPPCSLAWTIAGASLGCPPPSTTAKLLLPPHSGLRPLSSHQWSCCLLPQSCLILSALW
ncbi:vesicular integral-membrane protein VIP36 isoform X2 [Ovis aries]|uniref:vesicular integral-membrane protein VIP36 isoform X2 n=1 Tax=Ovis aries TaxID=9940 RepID=UPI0029526197|nr:vesicular integral-membrane protein VIP36 isoform X2 [Ovis aries]